MKKLIFTFCLGIASLSYAKDKAENPILDLPINSGHIVVMQTDGDPNLPVWVWKYLYRTTCGTYFYIELKKPITELDILEKDKLNQDLIMRNQIECRNKQSHYTEQTA